MIFVTNNRDVSPQNGYTQLTKSHVYPTYLTQQTMYMYSIFIYLVSIIRQNQNKFVTHIQFKNIK